ncbi:MAG: ribonuclease H-like domain-containing protein [Lachnospiraceae bacterium]|nr:ribonuclease H-like domain-containing protein [Lachnospiraceae bacterium]MDE7287160.1 ribonuclease H-like domain-containing protein [Lachnospiraceae bacterium]
MKTEEIILGNFQLKYPLERLAPLDRILFLDIETTGLLSSGSMIYLIGCAFFSEGNWTIRQWFAQSPEEESELVKSFLSFAEKYTYLIHYNGNSFDLPFIKHKADQYGLPCDFSKIEGLDIYRRIAPYKNFLKLSDCKLKTVEHFLGIKREDTYSGGELIQIYKDFIISHDYSLYHTLLLHNSDDMKGMLEILPVLSYYDLFNSRLKARKVQANYYNDIHGVPRKELILQLVTASPLPAPVTFMGKGCHFKGEGHEGTLIIPIYEEELKYFYANFKDYYYLPTEDIALHKSIASFVDKEYRQQAVASNCYTRKFSCYLPQWKVLAEPFFKREYKSRDLFFELTDDIKKNRQLFSDYASHVLNAMAMQD